MAVLINHLLRTTLAVSLALAAGCASEGSRKIDGPYGKQVAEAIPRIEESTGLKFKRPPVVEARSKEEVRRFLERRFKEDLPDSEIAGTQSAYRRLGLLPDTMDLKAFMLDLLTEQVVGYYDPSTKVLYVVKDSPPEQVGGIVAHELVHALQDQYIDLDSLQRLKGDNDRQMAASAVIEGQATLHTLRSVLGSDAAIATQFPGGWEKVRQAIRDNQSAMPVFAVAPRIIQETLIFPYLSGAEFMRAFAERKPNDDPFGAMPVSTEQVMHEHAYFAGTDEPARISLPAPRSATDSYQNNLGEFETRLFLYEHLRDQPAAVRGAAGWDGDRYMVVQTSRGDALVWLTVWDTAADAADFFASMDKVIARRFQSVQSKESAGGMKTYTTSDRSLTLWGGEQNGRPVVMYTDSPVGAGELMKVEQVKIERGVGSRQ